MTTAAPINLLPFAAALPDHPTMSDSIIYQINGLIVVFTALSLIWGLLELMALWFKWRARVAKSAVVPAVPSLAPASSPVSPDELAPELVAAMAAAVHATFGGSTRITSIVQVDTPDHGWTLEGRRQIHSARKVR